VGGVFGDFDSTEQLTVIQFVILALSDCVAVERPASDRIRQIKAAVKINLPILPPKTLRFAQSPLLLGY
jgi:hypothetical protein